MDDGIQLDRLSEQAGQQLRLAEVEISVAKQEGVIAHCSTPKAHSLLNRLRKTADT